MTLSLIFFCKTATTNLVAVLRSGKPMYLLQFDGMLQLIPGELSKTGQLGYGWLILNNGSQMARGFGLFARRQMACSNLAEYLALIEGLEALLDLRIWDEPIEIRGDAKCVIDQMKGDAAVNSLRTRKLHLRARRLANHFDSLAWSWIPRKENKLADKLSRRGLRQLHSFPQAYEHALYRLNSHSIPADGLVPLVDLRIYSPA